MSNDEQPEHTLAGPDEAAPAGQAPPAHIEESDPSADSRTGLAGEMGVSSERTGPVRGLDEEVTYGAVPTQRDDGDPSGPDEDEVPPEQSAGAGRPEANPASPGRHESDPASHPGHGV